VEVVRGNHLLDTLVVRVVVVPVLRHQEVLVLLVAQEIDKYQTVALPFQIKDILVVLDMVLVQITLDLVEVEEVLMLLEKMEAQIQQYLVVDMVVEEKQV
tara:strand:- start:306 stop:605 length:300 start_codon:yes stop_codon:yes gene_type:complete